MGKTPKLTFCVNFLKLKKKHIFSLQVAAVEKVVVLVRDPRGTMVSRYTGPPFGKTTIYQGQKRHQRKTLKDIPPQLSSSLIEKFL